MRRRWPALLLLAVTTLLTPSSPRATAAPNDLDALSRLSASFEAIADRVRPAVVEILASGYAVPGDENARGAGLLAKQRMVGSGVLVDADGYIITNAHVVSSASRLQVVLATPLPGAPIGSSILRPRGKVLGATVVGIDNETDLAVLKIDEQGLPFLELGDSETIRQGQLVLAFGSPLGLESSVTMGIISSVARQLRPEDRMIYIQTDAPINPGNSGGPLVDASGRVIGINTLIFSNSGGSEGVGFAAPSNIVRTVYEQIRSKGFVHRGEIGARCQTVTPGLASALGLARDWGVIVSDVLPGSAAAAAGLAVGDLVASLDRKPMENARQFEVNLYRRAVGSTVQIEVLRRNQKLTIPVRVQERPGDPSRFAALVDPESNLVRPLDVLALDIDDRLKAMLFPLRKDAGVLVVASVAGSSGGEPILPGDVIYAVNAKPVATIVALRSALEALGHNAEAVIQVQRSGELRFLVIDLD